MREFKFRVWDNSNNKWLKDEENFDYEIKYMIDLSGRIYMYIENGGGEDNVEYLDLDYEINQYTGLKDKYGNEIYEGDIVKDEIDEEIGYVEFSEGEYRIIYDNIAIILNRDEAFYIEVIGNIYENKEFLGDKI